MSLELKVHYKFRLHGKPGSGSNLSCKILLQKLLKTDNMNEKKKLHSQNLSLFMATQLLSSKKKIYVKLFYDIIKIHDIIRLKDLN